MSWLQRVMPWKKLRLAGVMGLNERNADFVLPYNTRQNYPNVDNKRITKDLALAAGIRVPPLYGVVEIEHQIERLPELLAPFEEFVIKPAHGSGGEGIWVLKSGQTKGSYQLSNNHQIGFEDLAHHVSNILSGMYSLGGLPDCVLIEYRVNSIPLLEEVSYMGVADIRTVVFRGVPVMAMIRLPTRISNGKANLHQGAMGVGIDLASGLTFSGVWHEEPLGCHPDTGRNVDNIQIPQWDEILVLTALCQDLVGLGYLGVDIVLDRDLGPLVLEMNARPGLSIQMANSSGLLPRLRKVASMEPMPRDIDKRIEIAKSFGRP